MLHQYIEQKINRKNRGVYFKKGKWILHVLLFIAIWVAGAIKFNKNTTSDLHIKTWVASILISIPFILFFYFYCLYLIPVYFKKNEYKKFWIILTCLLLIFPLLDIGLEKIMAPYFPIIIEKSSNISFPKLIGQSYKNFIENFIGFTSILFIMELAEGIRTSKEIFTDTNQLALTERNLLKTQMNPDFMIRSLDGIVQLTSQKSTDAPDAVIQFSDVLRYRLYRSGERTVLIEEELKYLQSLFQFQNTLFENNNACVLEQQGDISNKYLPPLSLINIAEPLINTYTSSNDWSFLIYLLAEEREIQIAIELNTTYADMNSIIESINNNIKLVFSPEAIFASEKNGSTYSLRLCLPIQTRSIVSS
jgi:hypothetical protein